MIAFVPVKNYEGSTMKNAKWMNRTVQSAIIIILVFCAEVVMPISISSLFEDSRRVDSQYKIVSLNVWKKDYIRHDFSSFIENAGAPVPSVPYHLLIPLIIISIILLIIGAGSGIYMWIHRRKIRKPVIIAISVVLCLTILLGALIYFSYRIEDLEPMGEYELRISPGIDTAEYSLVVPLLQEENGNISPIMKQLSLTGNGLVQIVNTTYGTALMIHGKGEIMVTSKMWGRFQRAFFTMIAQKSGETVRYWIFFTSNKNMDVEVDASGVIFSDTTAFCSSFSGKIISQGWQQIEGSQGIAKT
jgi:hypothetical protein